MQGSDIILRKLEEDKEFFNWIVEKTEIQKDCRVL